MENPKVSGLSWKLHHNFTAIDEAVEASRSQNETVIGFSNIIA